MVQVKDGEVTQTSLPSVGYLSDGRSVSGYDLLPPDILTSEGWLPTEDNIPPHDETQTVEVDTYTILADKVIVNYKII